MSETNRFTAKVITAGNCLFCGKKIITSNPLICDECASKLDDEMRGLIESKSCCACKHWKHFHGEAGICHFGNGCLFHDMRDVFDTCDNGNFEPKAFNMEV